MSAREPRPLTRGLAWLIAVVLRHRGAAAVAVVALTVFAAVGLTRLRVDFSSTGFYGDDSPAAQALAAHHERWGPDDATLLVLIEPTAADDPAGVVSRDRIAAIAALSRALEGQGEVVAVRSVATVPLPRLRLRAADPVEAIEFGVLAENLGLASLGPDARERALARLPVVPTLLSAAGDSAVIVVELGFSTDDVLRTRARVEALEREIAAHDRELAALGLQRRLAGVPAIRAGFVELVVHDQLRFVPLTLLIIGVGLAWCFRSVHGVLIPACAAALPTLVLIGIMAWTGEPIGLLNQVYFTLLPVIAVADAIHMLARYHEARAALGERSPTRDPGDGGGPPAAPSLQHQAIITAGSRVGLACLLTSLTTGAGFASLGAAGMPILRSFGLYAALGVSLALVTVVVLVPLLLSIIKDDPSPRALPGSGLVDLALRAALGWPRLTVFSGLLACALALIPAAGVVIDNHLSDLLHDAHPASRASARIDTVHGGVLGLEFELHAPDPAALGDPALVEVVHGFEAWLAAQGEVRTVLGPGTLVAASGPLAHEAAGVPSTRAGVASRLDLIAPFVPLEQLIAPARGELRIHAGLPDLGGTAFVAFADEAAAELDRRLREAPATRAVDSRVTSTALLAYRGVNGITTDLRRSFALVFLIVAVLIVVLFRSAWPALYALLPNGAPLLLGYACLGLVGIVLDPLAAVILTLGLGIAVDDSLHVMVRTREERAAGHPVELAVRRAVGHSGRAVMITTAIIAAGLSLNLFASFPALVLLGLLGVVVLLLALIFDLLVLPAAIVWLDGRGL